MNNQAVIATAQQTLLAHGVSQLPIRVYPFCDRMGIHCKLYHPKDDNDGCCGIRNNTVYIFIAERFTPTTKKDLRHTAEYRRFTTAHELGHALRGHVGPWSWTDEDSNVHHIAWCGITQKQFDTKRIYYKEMEQEADDFAAELLMPQCVLLTLGVTSAKEIAQLCETTYPDALRVWKRIRKRLKQGIGLTPTEYRVVGRFSEYIRQHHNRKAASANV
ncbi:MAG: ImmA/IrrE family metallo-endopeptidase [Clostridia bacterium]|nr:ImmA/IrrE family metallo-endopeptidase [Clostridia bacterium]